MNFIKKCPKCGFIADDKSQFCRSCGNPLKIKVVWKIHQIVEELKRHWNIFPRILKGDINRFKVESALNTASKLIRNRSDIKIYCPTAC